jgi:hypothetical protein
MKRERARSAARPGRNAVRFIACLLAALLIAAAPALAATDALDIDLAKLLARHDWPSAIDVLSRALAAPVPDAGMPERGVRRLAAMDTLVYAYLQIGQDDQASAVIARRGTVALPSEPGLGAAVALAVLPLRFALERGAWDEAAALDAGTSPYPQALALGSFARSLGAARGGQPEAALPDIARLGALHDELVRTGDISWAEQAEIFATAAKAWAAMAEGRDAEALALMRGAADREDARGADRLMALPLIPMRELLADMLSDLGQPAAALGEYERSLRSAPGRLRSYWGAARAAEAAGEQDKAKRYYGLFVAACQFATCQRPGLLTAVKRR